jgi:hypothetical protein
MPRSRIALEIGTHSPWISRLLSELGHEVIVANARKVRLIGESRKKDDRLDAQTLAPLARVDPKLLSPVKHRSAAGASRSDDDSGARRPGASPHGAGQRGPRTGEVLRGTLARLQRTQPECGESRSLESGTATGPLIATDLHQKGLLQRLQARGMDVAALIDQKRYISYISLDDADLVPTFMVDDSPDPVRLSKAVRDYIAEAATSTVCSWLRMRTYLVGTRQRGCGDSAGTPLGRVSQNGRH